MVSNARLALIGGTVVVIGGIVWYFASSSDGGTPTPAQNKAADDQTTKIQFQRDLLALAEANGTDWVTYLSEIGFDKDKELATILAGGETLTQFEAKMADLVRQFQAQQQAAEAALEARRAAAAAAQKKLDDNNESIADQAKQGVKDGTLIDMVKDKVSRLKDLKSWWKDDDTQSVIYIIENPSTASVYKDLNGAVNAAISRVASNSSHPQDAFCAIGDSSCGDIEYWPSCSDPAATKLNNGRCNTGKLAPGLEWPYFSPLVPTNAPGAPAPPEMQPATELQPPPFDPKAATAEANRVIDAARVAAGNAGMFGAFLAHNKYDVGAELYNVSRGPAYESVATFKQHVQEWSDEYDLMHNAAPQIERIQASYDAQRLAVKNQAFGTITESARRKKIDDLYTQEYQEEKKSITDGLQVRIKGVQDSQWLTAQQKSASVAKLQDWETRELAFEDAWYNDVMFNQDKR
jgi:type II secretory pathway pseudopilin PulG